MENLLLKRIFFTPTVVIASIFLGACSQITTLRVREIQSVEANLRHEIDSLDQKIDSLQESQQAFQRRIQADLRALVGAQENGINRMISMMEEMGYTVEKVAANTEKIKNKKIKVEHVIKSVDTSGIGMTITSLEEEEVDKLFKLANEEFSKGNFKQAYSSFKGAYKLKPTGIKAETSLFQSGVAAFSAKQYKPAQTAFAKVLELFPDGKHHCSVKYYMALIAKESKDAPTMNSLLKEILIHPKCQGGDEFFQAKQMLSP